MRIGVWVGSFMVFLLTQTAYCDPAGVIPSQFALKLTGTNIDPLFIARQVKQGLNNGVITEPGAVSNIAVPVIQSPLKTGDTLNLSVPVLISGGAAYTDVSGSVQVSVQSVSAHSFEPEFLYYSDDPEYITHDGVYIRGQVEAQHPSRLYNYHAEGTLQSSHRIVLIVEAIGSQPSTLDLIDVSETPNPDVIGVGHNATKDMLNSKIQNKGVILNLQPGKPYIVEDSTVKSDDLFVGTDDFNVLSGGPVQFTVLVLSPGVDVHKVDLNQPKIQGDGHNRYGKFNISNYGNRTVSYSVGAPDMSLEIGNKALQPPSTDATDPGHDYGDYGVTFWLIFDLSNPTNTAQTVYLYESPKNGQTTATYFLDADPNPIEEGCVSSFTPIDPSNRYLVTQFLLPPHSSAVRQLMTMTDGGSAFPLLIGASTVRPAVITSAGCRAQPFPSVAPGISPRDSH